MSNQKNNCVEDKETTNYLKDILAVLPNKPGVYQYFNKEGKIIYIGKAKNLKKRVYSYFNRQYYDNNKIKVLVKKIADIKYIVVETESDALLLENNLIKKYQPRYNVLLKDDKSFPWICVKNEPFPRIFSTRNVINDGSLYYGPYTSMGMVRTILEFIRELYQLRTCKYALTDNNIAEGKFKVCLEYHLGNCKGPCEGLQSKEEYDESIVQIKNVLKGNIQSVVHHLKDTMKEYAAGYKYEEANQIKEKLELLNRYQSKSAIVNPSINNVDVFSIEDDEKSAYVNFLKVVNGAVIQAHTIEMKKKLNEDKQELLAFAITELRNRMGSNAREIILPFVPDIVPDYVSITIPKRGDKLKLLELSQRNVKYYMLEKKKQQSLRNPVKRSDRILETMQKDLRLQQKPVHIECFDNSNIQGSNPVASCVVFKNAVPSKRDYRHFNIKTVVGPDDFASMKEIIYRRYKRLQEEQKALPQLIVIDGGKGQLGAALESLGQLGLRGKIAIIGIAKRLEEIYYPGDPVPLYLDKNSETLKIIQQLRDEAHRFGITHHRNKRSKSMINSQLHNIDGIGEKTAEKLLLKFHSVNNLQKASYDEIKEIVGADKAGKVIEYFNKNTNHSVQE